MDCTRVDILVKRLVSAAEAGSDLCTKWNERQLAKNSYQRPRPAVAATIKLAASTSFEISSHRIRTTYQVAFALIGLDFSSGDGLYLSIT